jgi:MFS family permease
MSRAQGRDPIFLALQIREFRILWLGTMLSFVAFFMAMIVQSVVAFEIAGNNSAVGLVVLAQGLGMGALGPIGGAFADRLPKRGVVAVGQLTATVIFVAIAWLIATERITILLLAAGAFLIGVTLAFLGPARQGLVVDLVPVARRGNAMAINNIANTGSRVVGPAVAGLLLSWEFAGSVGAYLMMALFYIFSASSLLLLPPSVSHPEARGRPVLADVVEGLSYVWGQRRLRILVLFFATVIFAGFPHVSILPGLAENVFGRSAAEASELYVASAVGALSASVWVVRYGDSRHAHFVYACMALLFGLSLLGTAWAPNYPSVLIGMFGVGVGSGGFQSLNGAVIARETEAPFIGRVMSLALLAFAGFGLMAFPYGVLADWAGERITLAVMGSVVLALTAFFSLQLVANGAIRTAGTRPSRDRE